mmetsp:Transcript_35017/g.57159  ORF Transcript_35017/g.57159 Transcript_35017/m.57159 type:complete len:91 (+) Transcript_35017:1082-1354(+)
MHNIANIAAETAHHLQILATLGLKTTAGNLNRSKYHATKDNKQERRPKRPPTNKIAHHQLVTLTDDTALKPTGQKGHHQMESLTISSSPP